MSGKQLELLITRVCPAVCTSLASTCMGGTNILLLLLCFNEHIASLRGEGECWISLFIVRIL
jgi:hypothetical protein